MSVVDPKTNLRLDPATGRRARTSTRSAWTASSVAGSRWRSRTSAKNGSDFIGWTDTGGIYREETRTMADGRVVPVFVLTNGTAEPPVSADQPGRILADL